MAASPTRTLLHVLHDRYGSINTEGLQIQIKVPKSAPGKTDDGELILPRALGLNDQSIVSIGDVKEVSSLCQSITELDLSSNSLCDWTELITLLGELPTLQFLNISNNPLCEGEGLAKHLPDLDDGPVSPANNNLTKVVLNSLNISWEDVWQILKITPSITELHLSKNNFSSVKPPPDGTVFPTVKEVFLNRNKLHDPHDLVTVGQIFPELENLVVIGNPLERLISDPELCHSTFPHVSSLNITQTSISDWAELEKLRHWPKLANIRLRGTPLLLGCHGYSEEEGRQLAIAYLPAALRLNGSPILQTERENAERAFIRHYMGKEEKPSRYDELHVIYGDLDPLVEVNLEPSSSMSVLAHVEDKSAMNNF